eukprot:jgi/Chlat1/7467/Chrsp6S07471
MADYSDGPAAAAKARHANEHREVPIGDVPAINPGGKGPEFVNPEKITFAGIGEELKQEYVSEEAPGDSEYTPESDPTARVSKKDMELPEDRMDASLQEDKKDLESSDQVDPDAEARARAEDTTFPPPGEE